jgi:fibronectin type 3 domain-containing protein
VTWNTATDTIGFTGYILYRAELTSDFKAIDTIGTDLVYKDVTVVPASQYSYKVVAFDAAKNISVVSSVVTVNTPAITNISDKTPPTVPYGLVCNGFSDNQVNLRWEQSKDTGSDGLAVPASGYNVYRDSQLIAVVTETSYVDKSVSASHDYIYYVKAFDASINLTQATSFLNVRTAAIAGAIPPVAPSELVLQSAVEYNRVALAWTASTTAGITYTVYRGAEQIANGITGTKFTDSLVIPNSTYSYTITAASINGESDRSNALSVVVPPNPAVSADTPPTEPTSLMLSVSATSNSVALTWAASTKSDGNKTVQGYDVLRTTGTGADYVVIATVKLPGYTDASVAPSTTYSYQIKAFSTNGSRSGASNTLTVKTPAIVDVTDLIPPSNPTNLAASISGNAIVLTWAVSTESDLAGYRLYRDGLQIADVTAASYVDKTVTFSTLYKYTVKAYDNPGNLSGLSNEVSVTTPDKVINTYTISGKVTINGIGLPNVLIALTGSAASSTITDADGNYSFKEAVNGAYIVTPTRTAYSFTPTTSTVSVSDANVLVPEFTSLLSGSVTVGVSYPDGTIIGGITYPTGTVINGITYPTATVIGGVTYPTGTVIGGSTYPSGVVIGGISYPSGTVVGGIAFPVGAVTTGITYPTGSVIGGVNYPSGTVTGGVIYPSGTVTGGVIYPSGTVIGNVTYPTGTIVGGVFYPAGSIIGGVTYPSGAIIGGVTYPSGAVSGGIIYPVGAVTGAVTYPTGTVAGGVIYPLGTVIGGVNYPSGIIVGGVSYPAGTVIGGVTYPAGTIIGGITYPYGIVIGGVMYPTATIIGGVIYPTGTVAGGVTYPNGTVVGGISYPSGTVVGGVAFPVGAVVSSITYPDSVINAAILFSSSSSLNVSLTWQ